jgi:ADP-heptose:LPS heptosyltransferase
MPREADDRHHYGGLPQCSFALLAGQLTLRQLASVIDHGRLFIGVDSVPMHMAAALGTPLVALFGRPNSPSGVHGR